MPNSYQALVTDLLARADIQVGGARPWDITVRDQRFYRRALAGGAMGLGESWMDGWWDCEALDQAFERMLSGDLRRRVKITAPMVLDAVAERLPNLAYEWPGLRPFLARFRSLRAVAETHYEVGNDLYQAMLDPRMVYSCGYWKDAATLEEAARAKLDLICRKLRLGPGQRVLDIGCGWAAFAKYAAQTYGVSVLAITISEQQCALGRELCAGLPVQIEVMDYREVTGTFDKIASMGMFEHVGRANHDAYMRIVHDRLADDGLFLLETMGDNVSGAFCNPWFQKYIFQGPTSMFPSIAEIAAAAEGRFAMEDLENIGPDYAPTLRAWRANVEARREWVIETYGERFYRMWDFYLQSCAGAFASRTYQMWQILFARRGGRGGGPAPLSQGQPFHHPEQRAIPAPPGQNG